VTTEGNERSEDAAGPELHRHLRLITLTLYGVGVIIGAGIYVLVGKIAGAVGGAAWLAFLGAALAALPTGLSYAELASRHPQSAGEAVFVDRAFERPLLSFIVGYLVLASGVASTAAVAHGFSSYLLDLVGLGAGFHTATVIGFLVALSLLNHRGIEEATWFNVLCTLTSVGALLVLVVAGAGRWGSADVTTIASVDGSSEGTAALIGGAALAFYAYIGFEDVCNVAEEVVNPVKTIPRAIIIAMVLTTVIYILVGITAVSAVPAAELASSEVPLTLVSERLLPSLPKGWLNLVALLATANTALFNLIMSSRILYGMGRQGLIPRVFSRVHRKRKTPTWGVVAAFVLAALFALSGVLEVLAKATNTIILLAFFSVNAALLGIRLRGVAPDAPAEVASGEQPVKVFTVPLIVPVLGLLTTAYLVFQFSSGAYLRAGALVLSGAVLYAVHWVTSRG